MPITHKNINRDYFVTIDVKSSKVNALNTMKFYNSDKKTSNIYVQLLINMSDNPIISKYVVLENASDYTLTLNIIKPDNKTILTRKGKLIDEELSLFEYDLDEECKDMPGEYLCELYVGCNVDGHDEYSTADSFTYTVKKSILTGYTIQDISDLVVENDKLYLKTAKGDKIGEGVYVLSYEVVSSESAIIDTNVEPPVSSVNNTTENESTVSDLNNINGLVVENDKLYLKKSDGSKVGEGVDVLSYEDVSSEITSTDTNVENNTENESIISNSNNVNGFVVENDRLYLKTTEGNKIGEGVDILSYKVESSEKVTFPDENEEDVTE